MAIVQPLFSDQEILMNDLNLRLPCLVCYVTRTKQIFSSELKCRNGIKTSKDDPTWFDFFFATCRLGTVLVPLVLKSVRKVNSVCFQFS